ncbi:MAG TPA: HAD family acid phosphatase [Fimbriimonadaceae bacterium]|jgi:acid phosphatase
MATANAHRLFLICSVLALFPAQAFCSSDTPKNIANLDTVKKEIISYHDSGRWHRDTLQVVHKAESWIAHRSKGGTKLALVLDIDETALMNWPEEVKTDFGYVPDLWNQWEKEGRAPASPEIMELFKSAIAHHVNVFFVTGRGESSREGTEKNLADVGYSGYVKLLMKPSTYHQKSVIPYKSSARAEIEGMGYHIVENVGDQWSDLKGGHSERTFKVPNPMYFIP